MENRLRGGVSCMAKRQEIRTISFVHMGDGLVSTDELEPEQRQRLATWLKSTYLNELFRGRAGFRPAGEGKDGREPTERCKGHTDP